MAVMLKGRALKERCCSSCSTKDAVYTARGARRTRRAIRARENRVWKREVR